MTILFDFEIKFAEINTWADFSEFEKSLFMEIKELYYQRLLPLKEEIDKQERELEDGSCCVIIHIMENPIKTSIHGYSEFTKKRISDSFSIEDFEYFNKRITAINQTWNN